MQMQTPSRTPSRTDAELPRTPPSQRPPPAHGPGPEPVPEELPGDMPEPNRKPTDPPTPMHAQRSLVGTSQAMAVVRCLVERVAPTDSAVLIHGASGCGKDLVAAALHEGSARRGSPLVTVDCRTPGGTLLEVELFGCEPDTVAATDRGCPGAFERAHGGTLVIDEFTRLPLATQARLLRVLETGQVRRVGGATGIPVDVRVLATAQRPPAEAVATGHVREDLYYRLAVVSIHLPPLRERCEDVLALAGHFLVELNARHGTAKQLSDAMCSQLAGCDWPGNVRQLRNVVERAYVLCDEVLDVDGSLGAGPVVAGARRATAQSITLPVGSSLDEIERTFIVATLAHFAGDKRRAASALGCSVKTLYNKLHLYRRQSGQVAAAS